MSRLLVLTAQDDSLAVCRVHSQIVSVRRIADGIQIVVYHCKGLRFITYSSMVIELRIISMKMVHKLNFLSDKLNKNRK